jgi:LDH2 family malate/lactate/ureidoglycolate dehydrogenase
MADFVRQTDWIAQACRNNPPRPGFDSVRMPGDRGLALWQQQMREGIALHPTIPPMLKECALRYGMQFPEPVGG